MVARGFQHLPLGSCRDWTRQRDPSLTPDLNAHDWAFAVFVLRVGYGSKLGFA